MRKLILSLALFCLSLSIEAQTVTYQIEENGVGTVKLFNDSNVSTTATLKKLKINDDGDMSLTDSVQLVLKPRMVTEIEVAPGDWLLTKVSDGIVIFDKQEIAMPFIFTPSLQEDIFIIRASPKNK